MMLLKCVRLSIFLSLLLPFSSSLADTYYWLPDSPAGRPIHSWGITPNHPSAFYASTFGRGIFRSDDEGETWSPIAEGLPKELSNSPQTIALDPSDPKVLYVSTFGGVYKSDDQGKNWNLKSEGLGNSAARFVATDPRNPNIIYTASYELLYKSSNGGESWYSKGRGLPNPLFARSIAIDPKNSANLYLAVEDEKDNLIMKSSNGGQEWTPSKQGLPNNFKPITLVIHPQVSSTLYLGTNNGLFKSEDSAQSWSRVVDDVYVRSIAIDSKNPSVVYLATEGDGILKSVDGAVTWVSLPLGQFNKEVYSIFVDPSDSERLFAGTFKHAIRSKDGGMTWQMVEGLPKSQAWDKDEIRDQTVRVTLDDEMVAKVFKVGGIVLLVLIFGGIAGLILYTSRKNAKRR